MKFRKAMTALAMSSAMVMAVPGVLEAKTTSFEDEGVVYYKVEQDGTVKSIAEEDYEARGRRLAVRNRRRKWMYQMRAATAGSFLTERRMAHGIFQRTMIE